MSQKSSAVQQARKELIQQTLDKICEPCDSREFKTKTFVVLCHLWLHNIAKEEELFELDEWNHPKLREQLIKKIEAFLNKHIK